MFDSLLTIHTLNWNTYLERIEVCFLEQQSKNLLQSTLHSVAIKAWIDAEKDNTIQLFCLTNQNGLLSWKDLLLQFILVIERKGLCCVAWFYKFHLSLTRPSWVITKRIKLKNGSVSVFVQIVAMNWYQRLQQISCTFQNKKIDYKL